VVRVIDPPAFNHQVKPVRIGLQSRNRLRGHVGQGGFWRIRLAIDHVGQMAGVEDAEHRLVHRRGDKAGGVFHHHPAAARRPCAGQISRCIGAPSALVLAVKHRRPAAQRHIEISLCQLQRDVLAPLPLLIGGDCGVGFPIAVGAARIDACRSGVGEPGGSDDAQRQPATFHFFAQQRQRVRQRILAHTLFRVRPDAEHPDAGFDARMHRGGCARRVGHLRIGVVGLDQRHMIELFKAQLVFLTRFPALLRFVDARGGDGGNAHAVADEQDDVFGARLGGGLLGKGGGGSGGQQQGGKDGAGHGVLR